MRARRIRMGLVLVVMAGLVGELGMRVARHGLRSSALGAWQDRADWKQIRTLEDGVPWPEARGRAAWALQAGSRRVEYRLDTRGFRVADGGASGGRAACEVLAIGDSNTFGYGVPAGEAFPAQLERLVRAAGVDAAVRNAGVCGSDIAQHRRWLEIIFSRHRADLVLVTVSPWSLRLDPMPGPPEGRTLAEKLWNVTNRRTATMARWSAIVDRGRRRGFHVLHRLIGWPPPSLIAWELEPLVEPGEAFQARWAGVAPALGALLDGPRAAGASTVLTFVPLDVQVSAGRNRLYLAERLPYTAYGFQDRDYTTDDRYVPRLARVAADRETPFVDTTRAMRDARDAAFLDDDYHLSADGYRRIAEELVPLVVRRCATAAARETA